MMTSDNKIELHIPSIMGFEKVAMECSASVAKKMGFTEDRIEDLKTAVAEACLNAIEHGNKLDTSTKVGVTLTIGETKLQVAVKDEGKGVGEISPPSIENKMEGKDKPRGWGLFLIKSLINEVTFEPSPEGGNITKMVIYLEK
ncbi:MAG: ATP-binding protein [Desulfobacterales bacterium]|nr:ATP-binding protein [Desulfobacterales bacterium]